MNLGLGDLHAIMMVRWQVRSIDLPPLPEPNREKIELRFWDDSRGGKVMSRKRFRAEQIISKLREAEIELAKGKTVGQACRKIAAALLTASSWHAVVTEHRGGS